MNKYVNGVPVSLTLGEEAEVAAEWAIANSVESKRAQIWEQIKVIRDTRANSGGYKVVVSSVDKWFHSDDSSRIKQIGLVMLGAGIPPDLQWKTMDGTFVTMTQTLAGQVFAAAAVNDTVVFAYAESLRSVVNAAIDPTSVDINSGWPAVYGE